MFRYHNRLPGCLTLVSLLEPWSTVLLFVGLDTLCVDTDVGSTSMDFIVYFMVSCFVFRVSCFKTTQYHTTCNG